MRSKLRGELRGIRTNLFRTPAQGLEIEPEVSVVPGLTPAWAALQVDVTQGNAQPLPIAIPDFIGDPQTGANVAGVVRAWHCDRRFAATLGS